MKQLLGPALFAILAFVLPQSGKAADTGAGLLATSGTYALDKSHGKVTWSISHLGFSTYVGQFSDTAATLVLDGAKPENSSLDVTVQTASVGTLNPALDTHLKSADFFNVEKFPTATFKSTKITRTGPKTAKVRGNFTLLGVTKPLTLSVVLNQAGNNPLFKYYEAGFTATAHLKRTNWGLSKYAPYLGDDVTLQIEGEFKLVK
jgi:polyisoprenoid-binding protein YceI